MLKVGVQTRDWYDCNDPMRSLEYIRSCGFEAIDFNMDTYLDTRTVDLTELPPTFFDRSVEEILAQFAPLKAASEATGVRVGQMHAPFTVWLDEGGPVNDYFCMVMDKCFAVCEYLGCGAIVLHPIARATREAEWAANLALYRSMIPLIRKYEGVTLCLENLFSTKNGRNIEGRLSNACDARRLAEQLNAEAGGRYFGFCLDVGHALLTRRNVAEFVREMGDCLTILHIHDNDGRDDQHVIPYSCLCGKSETVCDWDGFVQALKEIGYCGGLSFETFRTLQTFPPTVHTEALKLISAIGHHWAAVIQSA